MIGLIKSVVLSESGTVKEVSAVRYKKDMVISEDGWVEKVIATGRSCRLNAFHLQHRVAPRRNVQVGSRVEYVIERVMPTQRAGITIKLNKETIMLVIMQGMYTRTHEQQLLLTALQHEQHATLAAAYCSY